MNKLFTFLISAFIFNIPVFSQVEITAIIPNIGDELSYGETEVESFNPGPAGSDVTWDFSSFSGTPDLVANYQILSPDGASGAENFPENSMVWFVNFSDTAELNFYFANDPNAWTDYGFYNIQSAGTASKTFSNPAVNFTAPLAYQNTGSDPYEGTLSFNGTPVFSFNGDVSFDVDGWGTLIMPTTTYPNVLRVKTIENEDQIIAGITLNSIITSYIFYTPEIPVAVVVISISETFFNGELTETTTTVTPLLSYNSVVGIEKPAEKIELSIFPNPVSDALTLDFNSERLADLKFINTGGKVVRSMQIYRNTKVDVGDLPSGIYVAQLSLDGNLFSNARFIISR